MPFHVLQIFAVPVFIQLETVLRVPRVSRWRIFSIRALYVGKELDQCEAEFFDIIFQIFFFILIFCSCLVAVFTMFAAMLLPFFSPLLGFFGGFFFGPTTYFVSYLVILIY